MVEQTLVPSNKRNKRLIIDCDVHNSPKSTEEIKRYMKQPWRDRYKGEPRGIYGNDVHTHMIDAIPPGGGPCASDPEFLRKHLMESYGIQHTILIPRPFCSHLPDPDFGTAIAEAYNEWMADTWLGQYNPDGVFKGSISIAPQDPLAAAKEIEKWGDHPHFVQVMTDSGSRTPYGQRQYYPIFEACERYGLPFAIHPGTDGNGINDFPSYGYPTHCMEAHALMPVGFMAHLVSFLTEGIFERFPKLKIVLVEGGVCWLAPLIWRLDAEYRALRTEVPWLMKRPSEYLRDHVRITSQPLEQPDNKQYLVQALEMMDAENILMFSSDYPHWDFDVPDKTFPRLPEKMMNRILYENARELYKL